MAVSLSVIAAKDGAASPAQIAGGGLQAQDKSGTGAGPFTLGHVMIDGLAGTNMAAVTAANAVKVDGSAVTQPVSLTSTTITGTVAATQSGTWTVQPGNTANTTAWKVDGSAVTQPVSIATAPVLVAGTAIIGKVGVDQTTDGTTNKVAANLRHSDGTIITDATGIKMSTAQLSPLGQAIMSASAPVVFASDQSTIPAKMAVSATANGGTTSRINAAATTNATSLKASAGQIYTIDVFNAAAYNVFLKLYNKASAPTVGTDTPVMTIPIQAGGGFAKTWPMGLPFSTGIAYAITKLQADSDTTVVVAGDLTGNTLWI